MYKNAEKHRKKRSGRPVLADACQSSKFTITGGEAKLTCAMLGTYITTKAYIVADLLEKKIKSSNVTTYTV